MPRGENENRLVGTPFWSPILGPKTEKTGFFLANKGVNWSFWTLWEALQPYSLKNAPPTPPPGLPKREAKKRVKKVI